MEPNKYAQCVCVDPNLRTKALLFVRAITKQRQSELRMRLHPRMEEALVLAFFFHSENVFAAPTNVTGRAVWDTNRDKERLWPYGVPAHWGDAVTNIRVIKKILHEGHQQLSAGKVQGWDTETQGGPRMLLFLAGGPGNLQKSGRTLKSVSPTWDPSALTRLSPPHEDFGWSGCVGRQVEPENNSPGSHRLMTLGV